MKTFTAFVAGTIFGPAALTAWSLWRVGPEKRAEVNRSWKAAWNKGVEKAKTDGPPADDKLDDNWIAEITYSRANDKQFVGWMKYYWVGCTPDNVRRIMKELGITHGTTMVRNIHDGRIGMKQSRWWSEPGQSGISGEL